MQSLKYQPKLIGDSAETEVMISQIKSKALIDTGPLPKCKNFGKQLPQIWNYKKTTNKH